MWILQFYSPLRTNGQYGRGQGWGRGWQRTVGSWKEDGPEKRRWAWEKKVGLRNTKGQVLFKTRFSQYVSWKGEEKSKEGDVNYDHSRGSCSEWTEAWRRRLVIWTPHLKIKLMASFSSFKIHIWIRNDQNIKTFCPKDFLIFWFFANLPDLLGKAFLCSGHFLFKCVFLKDEELAMIGSETCWWSIQVRLGRPDQQANRMTLNKYFMTMTW